MPCDVIEENAESHSACLRHARFIIVSQNSPVSQHFLYARLKNGRIMLWQCLSVRPSVRPSFPDFFSTCFEISIWNLVYAFSRWHDMSSLSFITIGSLWPSLQPKVGQTQFLQSWPYKSRWILQIWYVDGPLYTSRHKFRFFSKILFSEFWRLFLRILDFAKFSGVFFYMFWDIILKHGIYI